MWFQGLTGLVSNWILMSSQAHRVTSGRTNTIRIHYTFTTFLTSKTITKSDLQTQSRRKCNMGNPTTDQKAHCFNDYFKQQQKISAYGIKPLTDIFQSAVLHNILSSQFENIPSPPPPEWGLGGGWGGDGGNSGRLPWGKPAETKSRYPANLFSCGITRLPNRERRHVRHKQKAFSHSSISSMTGKSTISSSWWMNYHWFF